MNIKSLQPTRIPRAVLGALLVALCGCGTIVAYNFPSEDPPKKGHYYLGVRCDIQAIKEDVPHSDENGAVKTLQTLFFIVDTPLSACGDTLYAPVMIFWGQPLKAEIVATNQVEQSAK
jgi:uncharacterized protein YceK